jgi:hypothetical protein
MCEFGDCQRRSRGPTESDIVLSLDWKGFSQITGLTGGDDVVGPPVRGCASVAASAFVTIKIRGMGLPMGHFRDARPLRAIKRQGAAASACITLGWARHNWRRGLTLLRQELAAYEDQDE